MEEIRAGMMGAFSPRLFVRLFHVNKRFQRAWQSRIPLYHSCLRSLRPRAAVFPHRHVDFFILFASFVFHRLTS
jgi:hypothetical protein